jgi:hypothetical protein
LHAYEPSDLSAEQLRWAERANHLHAQIQACLIGLAGVHPRVGLILEAESELDRLGRALTFANLQLWFATREPLRRAVDCAHIVCTALTKPARRESLGVVVVNAKAVRTALVSMTDMQRQTMLAQSSIALASDIAFDIEAEFDTAEAWRRWAIRAGGVPADTPRHDNDNDPMTSVSAPER